MPAVSAQDISVSVGAAIHLCFAMRAISGRLKAHFSFRLVVLPMRQRLLSRGRSAVPVCDERNKILRLFARPELPAAAHRSELPAAAARVIRLVRAGEIISDQNDAFQTGSRFRIEN